MAESKLPSAHSPLGASGAYRWLPEPWGGGCYGSVALSQGVNEDEEDDTYSRPGSAAHALAESCLRSNTDAWLAIGEAVGGYPDVPVDKEMADAVQIYLEAIRENHPDRNQGNSWIERSFHCSSVHPLFYGTADFVFFDAEKRALYVYDYKHGAGVVVDAERNPQLMYYACGVLEDLGLWTEVDEVTLTIAQPRGFHFDGPVRSWTISVVELEDWLEDILVPSMNRALVSRVTKSGEHCRFCPARLRACPQLLADQEEMWEIISDILGDADVTGRTLEQMEANLKEALEDTNGAAKLKNEQIARGLDLFDLAPILKKAYERTAFIRMTEGGVKIPNRKVVRKRMNRELKDGAEKEAKKKFGERAYTTPELKSPAEFDKMPGGKQFTARWAFKPEGDLTVVRASDNRRPVEPKDVSKLFKPVSKG